MNIDPNHHGFTTLCIHAGTHLDPITGGACSPIFTSTAYAFPNPANANIYPRYFNTPNQHVIACKMAALESASPSALRTRRIYGKILPKPWPSDDRHPTYRKPMNDMNATEDEQST